MTLQDLIFAIENGSVCSDLSKQDLDIWFRTRLEDEMNKKPETIVEECECDEEAVDELVHALERIRRIVDEVV